MFFYREIAYGFLTSCLLSTSTLLFLTSKAITYTMLDYDINCSFAEHFLIFLRNLFTKANVLPKVIKISCARGRHNMPPPFYNARCGPARLTPAALPKVVRRPACLASSSCGRHEYSQCTRQTDVRRTSSLNAFALSGRRHIKRTNTIINCASYSFQNYRP